MAECVAMNHFRKNMRLALDANGMTQQDLAVVSGISPVNISRILSGKEGVTLERAEKLSIAAGFPLSEMISAGFRILSRSA